MNNLAHPYQRHQPEKTTLYKVLEEHAETFFKGLSSDPDRKPLPFFVKREFDKFLACGLLSEGFVRLKCSHCPQSIVIAFSCKCRGFCPSCAGRRMTERAIYLTESVLPFVPMRHWILSVPFELRYWMAADDKLLKKVNQILCQEINNYLRKKARKQGVRWGETGVVSFLQRAGSAVNLNLHFHLLALDGIYSLDDAGEAIFTRASGIKNDEISRVLRAVSRRVLKYLRHVERLPAEGEEVYIGNDHDDTLSHIK
jgi:hypothetical protein